MRQLGFTSSELPKRLSYRHAFNPTLKQSVKLEAPSWNSLNILPCLKNLHACSEALALDFLSNFIQLITFGFCNPFDIKHFFFCTKNCNSNFTYHIRIDRTVARPAYLSLIMSAMLIPCSCMQSISLNAYFSSSSSSGGCSTWVGSSSTLALACYFLACFIELIFIFI